MNPWVALFVVAIVISGIGFTMLADTPMRIEERVLHGTVVGVVAMSVVGYLLVWSVGMSRGAIVISAVLTLGLSGYGWRRAPDGFGAEVAAVGPRFRLRPTDADSLWPVALMTLVSALVSIRILGQAYGVTDDEGISAGHLSTYGDWSAHLAYAASFAYGDNFGPQLPTAVGEPFVYHFGVDWFAAMFVPLGLSLQGGLEASAAVLATVFPGSMYLASLRFTGRRLAAGFGVLVFLASGGTAALYRFVFDDLVDGGLSVLGNLPRSYAFDGFDRNWVDNAVTGFLYPQRPTMIGFAAVMFVSAWLWQERERHGERSHAAIGVFVGLLPVFHVFAWAVLLVLGAWWALLERTRRWVWYLVPSVVLGLPVVLWQAPPRAGEGRSWHLGWMLGESSWVRDPGDFVWFWVLNTGLFIPFVALAMWRRRDLALRLLPIWGLLLIANVGIWHFWIGNNVKYVIFFLLLGAPFVGALLADWFDRGPVMRLGAVLALVSLTLSGGLDIWQAAEGTANVYPAPYLSGADVAVGEWARDHTPPRAVFATATSNVHPVRSLAGRRVVAGALGRLSDLGIDYVSRNDDLFTIYGVNEGFDEVIAKYGIDYVVLGPMEREAFRPADAPEDWDPAVFWDAAAPIVYDLGDYKVYDVRAYQESAP